MFRFQYDTWYMLCYDVIPVNSYACMYFHDISIKPSRFKFNTKQKQMGKNIWKEINPLSTLLCVLFAKNIIFDLAFWGKSTGDLFYKILKNSETVTYAFFL